MRSERVQRELDDLLAAGWRIREETPDRVVVVKPNYGGLGVHVLLFLLTFWWSFGAVNLAYALWKYVNDSPRRVLSDRTGVVGRREVACPNCGTDNPGDAAYCLSCGERLPGSGETKTCPDCGTTVAAGDSYCPNCGHAFDESDTAA